MTIDDRVVQFKDSLRQNSDTTIVRKFLTYGDCHILNNDRYIELKSIVADHFLIHPNEVLIVGSAKMGFSISENVSKNKYRYRHFSDSSDIDVAIVSSLLFDRIWKLLYDYIEEKPYWPKQSEFTSYHFRGWMRPDMLPNTKKFDFTQTEWWDFFNTLTSSQQFGPYKIRGGLYRSWEFLEKYQLTCINQCKDELNKVI